MPDVIKRRHALLDPSGDFVHSGGRSGISRNVCQHLLGGQACVLLAELYQGPTLLSNRCGDPNAFLQIGHRRCRGLQLHLFLLDLLID